MAREDRRSGGLGRRRGRDAVGEDLGRADPGRQRMDLYPLTGAGRRCLERQQQGGIRRPPRRRRPAGGRLIASGRRASRTLRRRRSSREGTGGSSKRPLGSVTRPSHESSSEACYRTTCAGSTVLCETLIRRSPIRRCRLPRDEVRRLTPSGERAARPCGDPPRTGRFRAGACDRPRPAGRRPQHRSRSGQ